MHIRRSTFVTGLLGSVSLISMLASAHTALANPEGASVEAGSATIGQADVNTLLIQQQTQRAIINWESFNVGNGETTRFVLPDAQSVTLNRDLSGSLSEVYGSIESNGRFFLVNPNGILFGPDSRIDVAGLVATTHDIRSQDFMAGRYEFSIPGNPDARVINQGYVSVQDLGFGAFVAPHVRNEGAVVARMGRVELASANGFTLDLHGDRLISFLVENPNEHQIYDANGDPIYALVENSGELIADGGVVAMSASAARGVIDGVINTDGIVQANTVEQRGGRIILGGGNAGIVRTSGQITARGEGAGDTGGEVEVTGELLWADEFARFDISGMFGGGRLMFGGDYLGGSVDAETAEANGFTLADRDIQTALAVRMDEGAIINADAIAFGDGGTVILWSDDTTRFGGEIFARGGPSGGDGGAVETSGRLSLDVTGTVDASAPGGLNGIWLLDPTADVYIVGTSQNQIIDSSMGGGSFFFEPIARPSFVRAQTIESALNSGTDVTVQTYNFSGEPGPGTIFLQENIRKTSGGGATLTFSANTGFSATNGNFIRSTSGPLNIVIDADSDDRAGGFIDVAGNSNYVFQTNGGSVDMRAWDFRIQGRAILTNGGNVTLRHIDDTATWMTIANSRGNSFVINAGSGDVRLDTNFVQGDLGDRIELGNYAIRGDRITIDAAAVTNIGEGFDYTNDEYAYTTPSFNNADGIGELFYRSIRYRGGAEEGTIDGSIISSTEFRDIERLERAVQQVGESPFIGPIQVSSPNLNENAPFSPLPTLPSPVPEELTTLENAHRALSNARNLREQLSLAKDFVEGFAAYLKVANYTQLAAQSEYFRLKLGYATLESWQVARNIGLGLYIEYVIERPLAENLDDYMNRNQAENIANVMGAWVEAVATGGITLPFYIFDQALLVQEAALEVRGSFNDAQSATFKLLTSTVETRDLGYLSTEEALEAVDRSRSTIADVPWSPLDDIKMKILHDLVEIKLTKSPIGESLVSEGEIIAYSQAFSLIRGADLAAYANEIASELDIENWPGANPALPCQQNLCETAELYR